MVNLTCFVVTMGPITLKLYLIKSTGEQNSETAVGEHVQNSVSMRVHM